MASVPLPSLAVITNHIVHAAFAAVLGFILEAEIEVLRIVDGLYAQVFNTFFSGYGIRLQPFSRDNQVTDIGFLVFMTGET